MSRFSGVWKSNFTKQRMPRSSRRLKAKTAQITRADERQAHEHRIYCLGEPRKCKNESCSWQARHRGSWCETCFDQHFINKTIHPVLCQGCPSFLYSYNHGRIRWSRFRLEVSLWIETNLELVETRPSKHLLPWIEIAGWKGARNIDEPRPLSGNFLKENR